jgi:predicted membrane protein
VELSDCEQTQALALRVILSLIKYSQQRVHELENCNGLSMIHQVLIKQKCIVGFHILKVWSHKIYSCGLYTLILTLIKVFQ